LHKVQVFHIWRVWLSLQNTNIPHGLSDLFFQKVSEKMPIKTPFYDFDRDEKFISDAENECPAVRDAKCVIDGDDLARWRNLWYPSCRVCPRLKFCAMSHQMQMAPPAVML